MSAPTIERPASADDEPVSTPVHPCPPWCATHPTGEDWSDTGEHHGSNYDALTFTWNDSDQEFYVSAERVDTESEPGPDHVFLAPGIYSSFHHDGLGLSSADARRLAAMLLARADEIDGGTPAKAVRPGVTFVFDGVEHVATVVMHELGVGVSIESNLSGEGNWVATFGPDELVAVSRTGATS